MDITLNLSLGCCDTWDTLITLLDQSKAPYLNVRSAMNVDRSDRLTVPVEQSD